MDGYSGPGWDPVLLLHPDCGQASGQHRCGDDPRGCHAYKQQDLYPDIHRSRVEAELDWAGQAGIPTRTGLLQNFPNPFNPATTIRCQLANRSAVRLEVYSLLGQRVATLVNETEEAGYHDVRFDGSGLASGVYFYRLEAGRFTETKKLVTVR